jgi:hypothetical protein
MIAATADRTPIIAKILTSRRRGEQRRFRVAAVREHVAAEPGAVREEREDHHDEDQDHDRDADAHAGAVAIRIELAAIGIADHHRDEAEDRRDTEHDLGDIESESASTSPGRGCGYVGLRVRES